MGYGLQNIILLTTLSLLPSLFYTGYYKNESIVVYFKQAEFLGNQYYLN